MSRPHSNLVLFLDGTWNTEDDSTNVLKAYHATTEGFSAKNYAYQKRYYDRGVGTGGFGATLLDSVTGGVFGLGLERNVKEAYNWLIDNYNDGDQVFIFGFSRGAYTARSLIGLISTSGLVRRGAPLTTSQLWNGYNFASENRSKKDPDWWAKKLNTPKYSDYFRRIGELIKVDHENEESKIIYNKTINTSEELLQKWSRRVDIQYVGLYDTVGALGVHALGIPGLRGRMTEKHNTSPTRLILNCRQALAVDENRSSFALTPLLHHAFNHDESKDLKEYAIYDGKISQKWFSGAHSNLGGGYSNNVLAYLPYEWIMKGAEDVGLGFIPVETICDKCDIDNIRDSFAEMGWGVLPHIIRAKRNWRPISVIEQTNFDHTLIQINEEVDKSVIKLALTKDEYTPPNIISYLERKAEPKNDFEIELRDKKEWHSHTWPGEMLPYGSKKISLKSRFISGAWMFLWSFVAAWGFIWAVSKISTTSVIFNHYDLAIIAACFILIDWAESKVTLAINYYPRAVRIKVVWNALYWMRILGLLFFMLGLVIFITGLIKCCFCIPYFEGVNDLWLPILSSSILISALYYINPYIKFQKIDAYISNQKEKKVKLNFTHIETNNDKGKTHYWVFIPPIIATLALLYGLKVWDLFTLSWELLSWHSLLEHTLLDDLLSLMQTESEYLFKGLLFSCLLQLAFKNLFTWVGKPMSKTKLDDILFLQTAVFKKHQIKMFSYWTTKLCRNWFSDDDKLYLEQSNIVALENGNVPEAKKEMAEKTLAWLRVREILRMALWRDSIGLVPLYTFIFGIMLYIGIEVNVINPLPVFFFPWWVWLVIATALFDWAENLVQLVHIHRYPIGKISSWHLGLGNTFSFFKFVGFFTSLILTMVIFLRLILSVLIS